MTLTTAVECSWTVASDADWVTLTGASGGQGSRTLTYAVAPNTTAAARSATLTVAQVGGESSARHDISQHAPASHSPPPSATDAAAAPTDPPPLRSYSPPPPRPSAQTCTFALSPGSASAPASGGPGSVTVDAAPHCAWTAASDVDWVTVTGTTSGQGGGTVTYTVAPNTSTSARSATIRVVDIGGASFAVHHISQQSVGSASTALPFRGAYTFRIDADLDRTCGFPVTTFYWPVAIEVTSSGQGTIVGSIVFPPIPSRPHNTWGMSIGPTSTALTPGPGSPGPAAAAYDLVVDGGRWQAGGPTRAMDGRGQIVMGSATGARLILVLHGSDKRYECASSATWSLLARYVDTD